MSTTECRSHQASRRIPLIASVSCLLFCGCAWGLNAGALSLPSEQSEIVAQATAQPVPIPVFESGEFDSGDTSRPQRIASAAPQRLMASRSEPFSWKNLGESAGGRAIRGLTIGASGYRTLVVAGLSGDDPAAVTLAEKLAENLHRDQNIFGGFQTTLIRCLNPDGEFSRSRVNSHGVYLNRQFSAEESSDGAAAEPEIQFLKRLLVEGQPQRVIHLRTIDSSNGIVAASSGAASAAAEVAEWLHFQSVSLPGNSADGTLERYLSEKATCDIVTVAVPVAVSATDVWELYGDSVLNLLQSEDYQTRVLARRQHEAVAADRRGNKVDDHLSKDDD
ncbi:MAG: hypothetical protein R3C49_10790 [Planctomycetaceae bacterium]